MSTRTKLVAAAFVAFSVGFAFKSAVSQQPGDQPPTPEQMQEMMKKWLDTIEPGPQHKELAKNVGEWNTTARMWFMGPSGPATETNGTSKITSVLDGCFIMEEHDGKMMMPNESGGMAAVPYKGLGLTGYDKYRNVFISSWCSNLGTNMLTMEGSMPPGSNTRTMYGAMDEPMLNVVGRTVKYETKHINDDKFMFTVYDLYAGPDYKVFEIEYNRKK